MKVEAEIKESIHENSIMSKQNMRVKRSKGEIVLIQALMVKNYKDREEK